MKEFIFSVDWWTSLHGVQVQTVRAESEEEAQNLLDEYLKVRYEEGRVIGETHCWPKLIKVRGD